MIEYSYKKGGTLLLIMDWVYKYVSLTAIIAALWFLVRYLIQKKIDSYFNKRLETYKHELTIITENAKYDINKKLYDFEAYASKRHSVYPELYRLVFEPWSELSQYNRRLGTDAVIGKDEMDMQSLRSSYYEDIRPSIDKLNKTYDYFYKNELYLSKDVTAAINEALDALRTCKKEIANSYLKRSVEIEKQSPINQYVSLFYIDEEYLYDAEEKIRILKETIYKELSYTHFEEIEKKEEALS